MLITAPRGREQMTVPKLMQNYCNRFAATPLSTYILGLFQLILLSTTELWLTDSTRVWRLVLDLIAALPCLALRSLAAGAISLCHFLPARPLALLTPIIPPCLGVTVFNIGKHIFYLMEYKLLLIIIIINASMTKISGLYIILLGRYVIKRIMTLGTLN